MPAAPDDWRRMGQEPGLMGVELERRPYAPPPQGGLRAWRSPSQGIVLQSFGNSPPADGSFAPVDDWEEISPPHPWDHDHCELCGATLEAAQEHGRARDPPALTEGYVTTDPGTSEWICDRCFEDFKDEFNWTVKNQPNRS